MKIKRINNLISKNNLMGVILPFPPVVIPIDDKGQIADEAVSGAEHYSTIAVCTETRTPYVFEFNREILDGLAAYNQRQGTISNIEILLSREKDDNSLRVKVGAPISEDVEVIRREYAELHNNLYTKYLARVGQYVTDL